MSNGKKSQKQGKGNHPKNEYLRHGKRGEWSVEETTTTGTFKQALPKSQKIDPSQVASNCLTPASSFKTLSYTGANVDDIGIFLDAIVLDLIRIRDSSESVNVAKLKMYCWWAMLNRVRDCGRLSGAYGQQMPKFPKGAMIPRALYCMLRYFGDYVFAGAKYSVDATIATEPAGSGPYISSVGTGVSNGPVWQMGNLVYYPAMNEYGVDAATAGVFTLSTVAADWDTYSEYISALGVGVEYDELTPHAPDGSFYAYVRTGYTRIYSVLPDFNASWGFIFSNTLGSDIIPPFSKECPETFSDTNSTTIWNAWIGLAWVTNRMSVKSLKEKNGWNYCGMKIDEPIPSFRTYGSSQFDQLGNMVITELQLAGGTLTATEIFCAHWIFKMALVRRMGEFCSFSGYSLIQNKWLPTALIATVKLPIVLAAVLETVGPRVLNERLYLPDFAMVDSSGLNLPSSSFWAIPVAGCLFSVYNEFGNSTLCNYGTFALTLGAQVINGAFLTNMATNGGVIFPRNLLNSVIDHYTGMGERLGANAWVNYTYSKIGGKNMMADAEMQPTIASRFAPIILSAATPAISWQQYYSAGAVRSVLPLGGKDLMLSLMFSRPLVVTSETFLAMEPFVYQEPNSGRDMENYVRMRQIVRDTFRSSSDFSISLGNARAKQRHMTLTSGTLEVSYGNNCGYWCQLYNNLLSSASENLVGIAATGLAFTAQQLARANNDLRYPEQNGIVDMAASTLALYRAATERQNNRRLYDERHYGIV